MQSVQTRLRDIAAARVKTFAGLPPDPIDGPIRYRADLRLPMRKGDRLRMGWPAYLLADALLQLPPDAILIGMDWWDYGHQVGMCFESKEFPPGNEGCELPRIEVEVHRDTVEFPNGDVVYRVKGLNFKSPR